MAIRLEIKPQPRLSWAKQVEICFDGIQHRFFRYTITLMVITVAVAFFVNVCVEWVVTSQLRAAAEEMHERDSRLDRFIVATTTEVTPQELEHMLGALAPNPQAPDREAVRAWIESDRNSDFVSLELFARRSAALERWYLGLPTGYRRQLGNTGPSGLRGLLDDANTRKHFSALASSDVQYQRPVWLDAYLAQYASSHEQLLIAAAHVNSGVDHLGEFLANPSTTLPSTFTLSPSHNPGETLVIMLAASKSNDTAQTSLLSMLKEHGLTLSAGSLRELAEQAVLRRDAQTLIVLLRNKDIQQAWLRQYGTIMDQSTAIARLAVDASSATWLSDRPGALVFDTKDVGLNAARITMITGTLNRRAATDRLWEQLADDTDRSSMAWLLSISMLVCIVGVSNAMLVSVFERFREIATMKCLGALDGFIAVLFIMEAGLLGLTGGLIGVVLGAVVGLVRMTIAFGGWTWRFLPITHLLGVCVIAIALGWLLTTLSAIYPSIKAALMPPMDAMRVG